MEGNLNARRRVEYVQKLLQEIGLEKERIRMVNLSSAMGSYFAEATTEIMAEILKIGLNPLKQNGTETED
ncbi:MAG: hydrogenase iron-sulfur subunit [Anaerolineales bacterium]